jgi:hypothetical protein
MTLWKIVQRHTYDLLSHKYSVIVILICISTIIMSVFQFGEVSSAEERLVYVLKLVLNRLFSDSSVAFFIQLHSAAYPITSQKGCVIVP